MQLLFFLLLLLLAAWQQHESQRRQLSFNYCPRKYKNNSQKHHDHHFPKNFWAWHNFFPRHFFFFLRMTPSFTICRLHPGNDLGWFMLWTIHYNFVLKRLHLFGLVKNGHEKFQKKFLVSVQTREMFFLIVSYFNESCGS